MNLSFTIWHNTFRSEFRPSSMSLLINILDFFYYSVVEFEAQSLCSHSRVSAYKHKLRKLGVGKELHNLKSLENATQWTEQWRYLQVCHELLCQMWTLKHWLCMDFILIYSCCLSFFFFFITTANTDCWRISWQNSKHQAICMYAYPDIFLVFLSRYNTCISLI
jgi:hypothetical protein